MNVLAKCPETAMIPVIAAPMLDPAMGRVDLQLQPGMTISEIIRKAMPNVTVAELGRMRVMLVNAYGSAVVESANWSRVKPRPGVRVVLRVVPGKGLLRTILQIVVSIAAVALGQFWALGLGFAAGTTSFALASGLIGIGVSVLGNMLINALIPPETPKDTERRNSYQISGWKNRLEPNAVVPDPMGTIRFAPPFAAPPYTEIVGDDQYIRAVFCYGYGGDYGIALRDHRLGDTSISEYDEVQIEAREGLATDQPLTLYRSQVFEEAVGPELTRPFPRDDTGKIIPGGVAVETPVVRTTGRNASGASVIIAFEAGLGFTTDKGAVKPWTVNIRIEQRPTGSSGAWTLVKTLAITAGKLETFFRQHTWSFGSRGRYDIRVTRMTDEAKVLRVQDRSSWVALQTLRPEYPFNFGKPLALVAVRIKATHQLNGPLDNFNSVAARRCLDWSVADGKWVARETSNPGSLLRYALQSHANPKPAGTTGVDLAQLQALADFCRLKGLKYDRVHEDRRQFREILTEIAAAGRALPRHDGMKWGVIIDRPQSQPVDHVNPRNSWDFRSRRAYVDPPHGFRVPFLDATNDYKPAERIIPWPGHSGDIVLTEALELPGKTDPDEIWIEGRRRMYEAIYRPDVYTCMQDGAVRVSTRGDMVQLNHDVLERVQKAARVRAVNGWLLEIDDDVTMATGQAYAIRFRVYSEVDTIGASVLRSVVTIAGTHNVIQIVAGGSMPQVGDIVTFGPALSDSRPAIITRVESGSNFSAMYQMADAAPIIDELTDAEVPPPWSGLVGDEIGDADGQPPAPRITSLSSGLSGAGSAGAFAIELSPGTGAVRTKEYRIEHRLVGASVWSFVEIPVADGGATVSGYANGDPLQIRARALSPNGTAGPYTNVVTITIGDSDAPAASEIDSNTVTIGALLGGAVVMFSTPPDAANKQLQLYRSTSMTLDPDNDKVGDPIDIAPSRSYTIPDGDTTRSTLIANGGFDSAAAWVLGSNWSITAAAGKKTAGTASSITQPVTFTAGKWYRLGYTVSGLGAGLVRARLSGGSNSDGAARTTNGVFAERVQAVSGNTTFGIAADGSFNGSVDDVYAYAETSTCLPQGVNYYWLETLNADGIAGPRIGPFSVTIK